MSEMSERVADALEAEFKKRVEMGSRAFGSPITFKATGVSVPHRDIWLAYAKTAIDAMREPSREMMTAIGYPNYPDGWAAWGAMIDEALK